MNEEDLRGIKLFLQKINKEIEDFLGIENIAPRSKVIVLFAYLETLFCLNIAYENKISDKKKIIRLGQNDKLIKKFYKDFCLNRDNRWYKENSDRLSFVGPTDLRMLRNNLTHFFQ